MARLLDTTKVAVPTTLSAATLKLYEPAGVALVVDTVKSGVAVFPPLTSTLEGENLKVMLDITVADRPVVVIIADSEVDTVGAFDLPTTVTLYKVVAPLRTGFVPWEPTDTPLVTTEAPSVNEVFAVNPELWPVAISVNDSPK